MKMITKKAQESLFNAIRLMEKGDRIEFDGLTFFIYNSQGCVIDYVNCYVN